MSFRFQSTALPGVMLATTECHRDERGFLFERYRESVFAEAGLRARFVQDVHSFSGKGVIRGLHYQAAPAEQGKLVWVATGEVFDVVVDVRRESPTRGKWLGHTLSGENGRMVYVPPGFAHGFAVLSDTAHVVYKCTAEYSPAHERGIRWNDPALEIDWPVRDPILSPRDRALPCLAEGETGFPGAQ
jgi:dTDP-4-dehydrorhamnose 3,5-epimerase